MKRILPVLAILLVLPGVVSATTYYVCDNGADCNAGQGSGWSTGSDSNSGLSRSSPWKTVQKCDDVMSAGDTCIVGDGTYQDTTTHGDQKINLYITSDASEGNEITFQAENKWGAVIEANPVKELLGSVAVRMYGASWIIIDGFEIKNAYWAGVGGSSDSTDIVIKNCKIHNCGRHQPTVSDCLYGRVGVGTSPLSRRWTVDSCVIYDIGRLHTGEPTLPAGHYYKHDHGWYAKGYGHVATNNIFYNIYSGYHISIRAYDGYEAGSGRSHIISNNVFAYDTNPMLTGGAGVMNTYDDDDYSMRNILIQNNIIYDPNGDALVRTSGPPDKGDNYHPAGDDNIIRNNVGDWTTMVVEHPEYYQTIENNAQLSHAVLKAQMTDPDNNDFTLVATATNLIDKGISNEYAPTYDIDGNLRDSQPDIGAFEYNGTLPDFTCTDVGLCCNTCETGTELTEYDSDCPSQQVCCGSCYTNITPSTNLCKNNTMTSNSNNFDVDNPVENLWDGKYDSASAGTAGAGNIPSFWVEFDFGGVYDLSLAKLFGDAVENWYSRNWSLYYKLNENDTWTTAFIGVDAFMNDWSEQQLDVKARYVRVEVFGNPDYPATQARELEILGTLSAQIHRADSSGNGCISMTEIIAFIDIWKYDSTTYPMRELMEAVMLWKARTGCS